MCKRTFQIFVVVVSASLLVPLYAQENGADYWKKYGGMPPLDIRVSLDDKTARGLFEVTKARNESPSKKIPLEDILIPVIVGQQLKFKVEISPRGANSWKDITKHPNLLITSYAGFMRINKSNSEILVVGDVAKPKMDAGIKTVTFYYSDLNRKDEQGAYTMLYFDIAGKP